jgi:radical SAM/Cys-rich protein
MAGEVALGAASPSRFGDAVAGEPDVAALRAARRQGSSEGKRAPGSHAVLLQIQGIASCATRDNGITRSRLGVSRWPAVRWRAALMTTTTGNLGEGHERFDQRVAATGEALRGLTLETVQVNIGLRCNLACRHCHVESGPKRAEEMDQPTMRAVLSAARRARARTIDITGGAPEMHPRFRWFVDAALAQGLQVMVRTNLTILLAPGYDDLPSWLAARRVHLVASMPCYLEVNVDQQRGMHVYQNSIEALRRLNALGYGIEAELPLDLVYNAGGAQLPGSQRELEAAYRKELGARFGISFTRLYALANLPIGRFLRDLERQGEAAAYDELLRAAFNPATLPGLMCRHQLHVGHDGTMYDCDFNYALGLPVRGPVRHVRDFDPARHRGRAIATGEHCYGCTAGAGSSCGGALT